MIKKNGVYFMFGSKLTGWDPNDNVYSTATKISGPWSSWKTFADSGSKTYTSQTNFILPLGDGAVYMGDRWIKDNLMRSTYIWLPLQISGTTATMKNAVNWVPNVQTGAVVRIVFRKGHLPSQLIAMRNNQRLTHTLRRRPTRAKTATKGSLPPLLVARSLSHALDAPVQKPLVILGERITESSPSQTFKALQRRALRSASNI